MNVKAMSVIEVVLWFFGMSLIIFIGLHVITPLVHTQVPLYLLYYGSMSIPLVLSLVLVIALYKNEKKKGLHNLSFRERYRLYRLGKKDLIYTGGLILFWFVTFIIINGFTSGFLSRPDYLSYEDGTWFGVMIEGNYYIIIWSIFFLTLNVYGEELFWRGYMMPRLEQTYGHKAWIINGTLWTLFHLPVFYVMPAIAPGAILLVYIVQKRKNTNIGVVGHFALNGAELIPLILVVLSIG